MVLIMHFNQSQLYIMHSGQSIWYGLCLLKTDTFEAKGRDREGYDIHSPYHGSLDKGKSGKFLLTYSDALPEPEPTKS